MTLVNRFNQWALMQVRLFFVALQYFTRLPVPQWVGFDPGWLQHAVRFFPLIGLLVGALISLFYCAAHYLWSFQLSVLLSVAVGILFTGALHEDGFADMCDGFGGGSSSQRILEIMKDSRIGAYGAIGIGLLLAIKCTALCSLSPKFLPVVLLIAHSSSRLFSTMLIWRFDYVREEGKAKPLAKRMAAGDILFAVGSVLIPILVLACMGWLPWQKMICGILLASLGSACLVRLFLKRLGGYTGDCLGAVQQISEIGFYLGFLAC